MNSLLILCALWHTIKCLFVKCDINLFGGMFNLWTFLDLLSNVLALHRRWGNNEMWPPAENLCRSLNFYMNLSIGPVCDYLRHSSHCTKMVIIHSVTLHMKWVNAFLLKCRGELFCVPFHYNPTTGTDVVNWQNAYACAVVMGSVTVFAAVDCIAW